MCKRDVIKREGEFNERYEVKNEHVNDHGENEENHKFHNCKVYFLPNLSESDEKREQYEIT